MNIIETARAKQPLIHHLTNQVVMNFTANGLLSFGASPIMAKEAREVREMAGIADGVLINIGTAVEQEIESMILAGQAANEKGIPVVLDPVGVAATSFRRQSVDRLLGAVEFTAIKGNAGEMAYLVDMDWKTKGVESIDDDLSKVEEIAIQVAVKYGVIAIVTGEIDAISDGETTYTNDSGHELLTRITGAGCLLGSIITACLTVAPTVDAAYQAVQFYGRAAEHAAAENNGAGAGSGSGTFLSYFINALGI